MATSTKTVIDGKRKLLSGKRFEMVAKKNDDKEEEAEEMCAPKLKNNRRSFINDKSFK